MPDPTADDMRAHLTDQWGSEVAPDNTDGDLNGDAECAIYWFAADHHGGQWSNLYAALSTSEYHPGRLERGPEDFAADLYQSLVMEFVGAESHAG